MLGANTMPKTAFVVAVIMMRIRIKTGSGWRTLNIPRLKIERGTVRIMKKLISLLVAIGTIFTIASVSLAEEDCICFEDVGKSMTVGNPDIELSVFAGITPEGAYMRLFGGLSVTDTMNFWNDVIWLKDNTDIRNVNIFINSPGGSAFDGLALANWISFAQDNWGFHFHGYASGIIASAALPVFVAMETRSAQPTTIFMIHEASLFKWPGSESASDIRSQNDLFNLLGDAYIGILVNRTNLSKREWKIKEGYTTWFGAEEAKLWGVLTDG